MTSTHIKIIMPDETWLQPFMEWLEKQIDKNYTNDEHWGAVIMFYKNYEIILMEPDEDDE